MLDADMYNGRPLPKYSRKVKRCFRGSFLVVQKTSLYNRNPQTYDGRHNEMGADRFRRYCESLIAANQRRQS